MIVPVYGSGIFINQKAVLISLHSTITYIIKDPRKSFSMKNGRNDEIDRFGRKNKIHTFWWKADEIFEICDEKLFSVSYKFQVLYILQRKLFDIIRES